jgi:hypothetical protein
VALRSALVDRARRVVPTPLPEKVEGTTIFETLRYPWFRCRVTLNAAPDSNDAQGGRRRTPRTAEIMCGVRDQDRNRLTIRSADRLEVYSKQLGRGVFEITSDGEPIRKKRKVIGWTATIVRVNEHEFEEAEP